MQENQESLVCNKCGYNFHDICGEILVLCPDCKDIKRIDEFSKVES